MEFYSCDCVSAQFQTKPRCRFLSLNAHTLSARHIGHISQLVAPDQQGQERSKTLGYSLADCNEKLRSRDIQFTVGSFGEVRSRRQDFMYLDPPPRSAKAAGYCGRFDHRQFFQWLERQRAQCVLSLSAFVDDCVDVPEWYYDEHIQIDVGTSPYRQTDGDDETPFVAHSLYVRRER